MALLPSVSHSQNVPVLGEPDVDPEGEINLILSVVPIVPVHNSIVDCSWWSAHPN